MRRVLNLLSPYDAAKAETQLKDLKYSPEVALRMAQDNPKLAQEIPH